MTSQAISQAASRVGSTRKGFLSARIPALADLLAVPGFLQLCAGNGVAQALGQRIQGIAVGWLVLEMSGSTFWLGIVNGAPAISILLFSLAGGVLADRWDARRVLLASRMALALAAVLTALLVMTGQVQLVHLVLYVLVVVGITAIERPVALGLVHEVVGSNRLLGANAMQSVLLNAVNIVTPVGIGLMSGVAGSGSAFWVLGVAYTLAALLIPRQRSHSVVASARRSGPLADIQAGFAYIRATPAVAALLALAFLVPIAGAYFAMVPVYAYKVLAVGPGGLGVLVASFSAGGLVGALYLAIRGKMRHRGVKLMLLGAAFGAGMIAFALSQGFLVSCLVSFYLGMIAGLWQNTLGATVQQAAAVDMRGRVVSVFTMAFQLMGLGWLIAGLSASVVGPQATVFAGGVAFAVLSVVVFAMSKDVREID